MKLSHSEWHRAISAAAIEAGKRFEFGIKSIAESARRYEAEFFRQMSSKTAKKAR